MSDLIYQKCDRWEQHKKTILSNPTYRDTILRDYFIKKRKGPDLETLREIVWDHINQKKYPTASNSELVMHVRLGDRLDGNALMHPSNETYKKSLDLYTNFLPKNIKQDLNISKVTVVTAMHFGGFKDRFFHTQLAEDRSFEILDIIKQHVTETELEFEIVSNDNFDKDFVYMVSSKYFMQSFSEVSFLASKCLRDNATIIPVKLIRTHWEKAPII